MNEDGATTLIMRQKRDYMDDDIISFPSNKSRFSYTVILAAPTIFTCCLQDILLNTCFICTIYIILVSKAGSISTSF
jgi:hypothetical protein